MERESRGVRVRIDRALRTMEGQHRRLQEIHAELDLSVRRGDAKEVEAWIDRLHSALRAHFEIEESVVFPALAELEPDSADRVGRLASEHGSILATLEALVGAPAVERGGALGELQRRLATHESDEESVVRQALDGPGRSLSR